MAYTLASESFAQYYKSSTTEICRKILGNNPRFTALNQVLVTFLIGHVNPELLIGGKDSGFGSRQSKDSESGLQWKNILNLVATKTWFWWFISKRCIYSNLIEIFIFPANLFRVEVIKSSCSGLERSTGTFYCDAFFSCSALGYLLSISLGSCGGIK